MSYPQGLAGFLYERGVPLKDFKDYAPRIAERVKAHVKALVEQAGAPFRHLVSKEPMEELARQRVREEKISEGVVCGFSQLETCRTFRLQFGQDHPRLRHDQRKCLALYVFLVHPVLGLIHVKILTWFPLMMQVYVNGHDYLAKQLDGLGVKYTLHDNAFRWVADLKAAQRSADRFVRLKWPKLLSQLAGRFNPLLGRELADREYYWVTDQAEYATDVLFDRPSDLQPLYRRMVEHARVSVSAEDVLRFLGRKPHGNFRGEVRTHVGRRVEGVRVVHWMKANKLKMYDKAGVVLRIETTINNPNEFRVRRRAPGQKEPTWQPLLKGVGWLWRYADVGGSANRRYLEALAVVEDDGQARRLIDRATKPATLAGRRRRALQPLSPADQLLFLAVLRGEHRLGGFRNRDIAAHLYPRKAADRDDRRRRCARVTRLIQLLRAHRLIAKVPRTRRYQVTRLGELVMGASVKAKELYFPRTLHEVARSA